MAMVTAALPSSFEDPRTEDLPCLLYIGDVPVEATVYGSALLHRLLSAYPADKLCIIEGNLAHAHPDRRLAGVRYATLHLANQRLYHTRLSKLYGAWLLVWMGAKLSVITRKLAGFRPGAVLTVAHGFSWLIAAAYARRQALPLHLIVHDDWISTVLLRSVAERKFAGVYRGAAARFCVSGQMASAYRDRFGVGAQVLHPTRAAGALEFCEPPERLRRNRPHPVFAYGGSISVGYRAPLQRVARALARVGGRLLIFGPLTKSGASAAGLDLPNVSLGGMLASNELARTLRDEADVLVLPMSFEPGERTNMELAFPSKLADYTAVGLPILIHGPPYCSAARWARENGGVAEVAATESDERIARSVRRLCLNPGLRWSLACAGIRVGAEQFAHAAGAEMFLSTIRRGSRVGA